MENVSKRKRILGSLTGGAVGDALGYAVEFMSLRQITGRYGSDGITSYKIDAETGKAVFSDDTQMTLFTAEGLLWDGDEVTNIYNSYMNWYKTQTSSWTNSNNNCNSHLMTIPELFVKRAPGNTCMSALRNKKIGTVDEPLNNSKGCGGVMRVAPVAFMDYNDIHKSDTIAIRSGAITHGHPLGYLPCGLLVHIIHTIIYGDNECTLKEKVEKSIHEFEDMFSDEKCMNELIDIVSKAITLSENDKSDRENIKALGEGWVAEETLAIALYCVLRHCDDFSAAIIASVNHDGDSDSTGAVTGNILGAYLGIDAISEKWIKDLEMYDVICCFADRMTDK